MNIERPTSNVEWEKMKKHTMEDKTRWVKTHCGRLTEKNEHRTSNVQHRILNGKI